MKKLMSVFMAAAVLVPLMAQGEMTVMSTKESEISIYGKVHGSVDYYNKDGAADDTDAKGFRLQNRASRFGVKAKLELSEGLDAIAQAEVGVDLDGDNGGGFYKTRNTYVGLKSDVAGKLLFGIYDCAYKLVAKKTIRSFGDTLADTRNMISDGSGREKNNIFYQSPKFAGLYVMANYAFTAGQEYDPDNASAGHNFGAALAGSWDMVNIGLGYNSEEADRAEGEDKSGYDSILASAKVTLPTGTAIFGGYEKLDNKADGGADVDAYIGGLEQKIDKFKIKAYYAYRDPDSDKASTSMYAAGVDYKVAKDMTVYVLYTAVDNEDNAKVNFKEGKVTDVAVGDDLMGVSLGLVYNF
jgi:predicted porin